MSDEPIHMNDPKTDDNPLAWAHEPRPLVGALAPAPVTVTVPRAALEPVEDRLSRARTFTAALAGGSEARLLLGEALAILRAAMRGEVAP